MEIARKSGIGAQFGGKYFALDARVIRLPRHGASCPVGIGVSCSADRNIKAKIDRDGLCPLHQKPPRPLVSNASVLSRVPVRGSSKPWAGSLLIFVATSDRDAECGGRGVLRECPHALAFTSLGRFPGDDFAVCSDSDLARVAIADQQGSGRALQIGNALAFSHLLPVELGNVEGPS